MPLLVFSCSNEVGRIMETFTGVERTSLLIRYAL